MTIVRVRIRDFRCYESQELELGAGITIVHGANAAGKTNLLEAVYFGCVGRSCRTTTDRETIRFDAPAARVELDVRAQDGDHSLAVGLARGDEKVFQVDGARVERISEHPARPLVAVFQPDRLELVKGAPALRRAHLDHFVAALWPSRAATRRAYAATLAQRNALLARCRHGGSLAGIDAWDEELAAQGIALRDDRAAASALLAEVFPGIAAELGLEGAAELRYRPRSNAGSIAELVAELRERRDSDASRGFTQHGPHRDEVSLLRDGRELRAYGSQGEQRLALLATIMAERQVLGAERGRPPLLLLDDVMSELDSRRRALLCDRLADGGQALITTTDLSHVPCADSPGVVRIEVRRGSVVPGISVVAA